MRAIAESAAEGCRGLEPKPLVEGDRVRLRVDHDSDTANGFSRPSREDQSLLQQLGANSPALGAHVNGQPRDAQRWQRVRRQPLATKDRQARDLDFSGRDRDEAEDLPFLHRHIGRADVVTELVLAREALEEPVEIDVARREVGTIVVRLEASEFDGSPLLEQFAERFRRLPGLREPLEDSLAALACLDERRRSAEARSTAFRFCDV